MSKASDNQFPSILAVNTSNASISNASPWNAQRLFFDADGSLKRKDSSGTVTAVEGGGSITFGGVSSTDTVTVASNFSVSDQGGGTARLDVFFPSSGGSTSGEELDYVEITSDVSVTSTSSTTPTTVITGTSQSYDAEPIIIEFNTSGITPASTAGANVIIQLWDGATNLGRISQIINPASAAYRTPASGRYRYTPTAATHQYIIKAYQANGNGTVNAGDGTSNGSMPSFIRVIRA